MVYAKGAGRDTTRNVPTPKNEQMRFCIDVDERDDGVKALIRQTIEGARRNGRRATTTPQEAHRESSHFFVHATPSLERRHGRHHRGGRSPVRPPEPVMGPGTGAQADDRLRADVPPRLTRSSLGKRQYRLLLHAQRVSARHSCTSPLAEAARPSFSGRQETLVLDLSVRSPEVRAVRAQVRFRAAVSEAA